MTDQVEDPGDTTDNSDVKSKAPQGMSDFERDLYTTYGGHYVGPVDKSGATTR